MSQGAIEEHPGVMQTRSEATHHAHDRGLLLIGLFKLAKSLFFFCVGIGAIHLLHKDLGDVAMKWAVASGLDIQGRLVTFLMNKVNLIDVKHLRDAGLLSIGYSCVALVEGIGLLKEKVWAEYLTLGLTISLLPWEIYELIREPDAIRLTLLLANLAVLWYLVWLIRRKKPVAR